MKGVKNRANITRKDVIYAQLSVIPARLNVTPQLLKVRRGSGFRPDSLKIVCGQRLLARKTLGRRSNP
ncbi:hypothetical protein RiCNE_07000 [Rickettsia endosymbiont of Culicoides newsteadi]|nr:hypothetical protein RiCNE_07000 [Rickettsia endosymbiont of Culicoides newsteadi]